jgi:signal transduction histidine kinase/ActR/RegA family two-component response regulator
MSADAHETSTQLEELNTIGIRLSAERHLDTLLELILSKGREITRSDAGSLYVVEKVPGGGQRLRFKLAQNDSVHVAFSESTLPISADSVAGYVALSGEMLRIDDAYAFPPESPFQFNAEFDARLGYRTTSMLVVPMKTPEGEIIGVLELINCKRVPGRALAGPEAIPGEVLPFPERYRNLAASLASQAAVAIRNAHLLDAVTRRQHRLETLIEVSRQASRLEPLDSLAQRIAEACGELLGADSVRFRILDGDELVLTGTWGEATEGPPRLRLQLGEGLSGLAAARGEALVATDIANDARVLPSLREAMEGKGERALLAVPVKSGERVVGVLSIRTRLEQVCSEDDAAIATVFASQAGVVLENSRLFQELRTALQEVEASQQQLVQRERLSALGEMAAGVAHDFNNLLAVVLARSELLLARGQDSDVSRQIQIIRRAALDGAHTVRRILEFTRTRQTRPVGRVDIPELLREVVELTSGRWKDEAQSRGISYEVAVEGKAVSPVGGISAELREVFMNLMINGLDAMPEGGRFVFRVSADAATVTVAAEDAGCGMSDETRRRVLEPFFTTKDSHGTGLGLAVSWGIIQRHGGTIDVQSTLGAGTTFLVRLPILKEESFANPQEVASQPVRGARVLVIDDQDEVRSVLRDTLISCGHAVVEAASGEEGLARCAAGDVDVILTDVSMPGMSGWEVAAACQRRFPQIPVGFVTGWGDRLDPQETTRSGVRFIVSKPFGADDLQRHVAAVLRSRSST